ncbi:MAG: hypothetical protein RL477_552 [Pseudomonadota bacterium]
MMFFRSTAKAVASMPEAPTAGRQPGSGYRRRFLLCGGEAVEASEKPAVRPAFSIASSAWEGCAAIGNREDRTDDPGSQATSTAFRVA